MPYYEIYETKQEATKRERELKRKKSAIGIRKLIEQ